MKGFSFFIGSIELVYNSREPAFKTTHDLKKLRPFEMFLAKFPTQIPGKL